MRCYDSDLGNQSTDENQSASIPVPRKPFEFHDDEFVVKVAPDDTWEITHRNSSASAVLCHIDTDPVLAGYRWHVANSLCPGVAAFATLLEAECHIATLLRPSGGMAVTEAANL